MNTPCLFQFWLVSQTVPSIATLNATGLTPGLRSYHSSNTSLEAANPEGSTAQPWSSWCYAIMLMAHDGAWGEHPSRPAPLLSELHGILEETQLPKCFLPWQIAPTFLGV